MKKISFFLFFCFILLSYDASASWWKTALADASGAFVGACEGSTFGPYGSAAGAVLCGAYASVSSSKGLIPVNPMDAPSLPFNPFEMVGKKHNEVVLNYKGGPVVDFEYLKNLCVKANSKSKEVDFSKFTPISYEKLKAESAAISLQKFDTSDELCGILNTRLKNDASRAFAKTSIEALYRCSESISDFNRIIVGIDANLAKSSLDKEDVVKLQLFIAVFCHSANLWSNTFKG